jgi:hypothetical protein
MVTVSYSLLTAAHWTGAIDGQNCGWPPHQLVCGMTTVAALGTTRAAEENRKTNAR